MNKSLAGCLLLLLGIASIALNLLAGQSSDEQAAVPAAAQNKTHILQVSTVSEEAKASTSTQN